MSASRKHVVVHSHVSIYVHALHMLHYKSVNTILQWRRGWHRIVHTHYTSVTLLLVLCSTALVTFSVVHFTTSSRKYPRKIAERKFFLLHTHIISSKGMLNIFTILMQYCTWQKYFAVDRYLAYWHILLVNFLNVLSHWLM